MPRNISYKDIDISFRPVPGTGDLSTVSDNKAVEQSIKNIIQTNFNEFPFRPIQGGDVRSLLFELNTPLTAKLLEDKIVTAILNYEPRALLMSVDVNVFGEYSYDVTIRFKTKTSPVVSSFNTTLNRVR